MKYLYIFLIIFSQSVDAQEVWDLEKCINHALSRNISITRSQLGIANAEIDVDIAKQARYPDLNGNAGLNLNFGRTVDPVTNLPITERFLSNNYGLNSRVTLYNGMRIKNSIKQSEYDLKAVETDMEQTKVDLSLQIANTYLQALFASENIKIAQRQLDLTKQQLDQINKLIRAGARPAAERLNLEAQIAQGEQNMIATENNYLVGMLQLKQLLRLPPDYAMELTTTNDVVVTTDPDMVDFNDAYETARLNRPDLRASEYRLNSAETGINLAKSALYPSIGAGGNVNTTYSNNRFIQTDFLNSLDNNLSYGIGAFLNVPIYNNGNPKGGVSRAKLNLENEKLNKEQLQETLKLNVQQAISNARASKRKSEASEKSVEAQQLAFDNTTKRLDIGDANSFEWDNQKTQLEQAEITRLIDKYQYLLDIKVLEFYLGKPLKM